MTVRPIRMTWDGEVLRPASDFWARRADEDYCIGEVYEIAPIEQRSMASHGHYFAVLNEGWKNLPEKMSAEFPTPDHLRSRLLIATGWRDQASFVCSSKAEAIRLAAFMRPMDPFAVVAVNGAVVVRWTARSQAIRAMGKDDFQKSKDDVLGLLATVLEVGPEALELAAAESDQ